MSEFNRLLLNISKNSSGAFWHQFFEMFKEYHVYGEYQFLVPYPLSKHLIDILNSAITSRGYDVHIQFLKPQDTLIFSCGSYLVVTTDKP